MLPPHLDAPVLIAAENSTVYPPSHLLKAIWVPSCLLWLWMALQLIAFYVCQCFFGTDFRNRLKGKCICHFPRCQVLSIVCTTLHSHQQCIAGPVLRALLMGILSQFWLFAHIAGEDLYFHMAWLSTYLIMSICSDVRGHMHFPPRNQLFIRCPFSVVLLVFYFSSFRCSQYVRDNNPFPGI